MRRGAGSDGVRGSELSVMSELQDLMSVDKWYKVWVDGGPSVGSKMQGPSRDID